MAGRCSRTRSRCTSTTTSSPACTPGCARCAGPATAPRRMGPREPRSFGTRIGGHRLRRYRDPPRPARLRHRPGRMISAAAEVQRRLWGTDPRAWAELAESHNRPLFEAVLEAAAVGPGTAVLDVGCGSGL